MNGLQSFPLPKVTVIPNRRNPERAIYRRFVDFIKSCRSTGGDYPADLLATRREIFIDSIKFGILK